MRLNFIERSREELRIIDSRLNEISTKDINIFDTILKIDRYIEAAEKGANVIAIQRPTIPKKVSPNSSQIRTYLSQFLFFL